MEKKELLLTLPHKRVYTTEEPLILCEEFLGDHADIRNTMHSFLMQELGMNEHEAGMLLSVTGNLCICQVVDPEKTVRMEIPLSVTKAYGYEFD